MDGQNDDRVSPGAFRSLVASLGFKMQPQDEAGYLELLRSAVEAVDHVQALPEYHDPRLMAAVNAGQARTYTRPPASENPLNAWSHRTEIKPTRSGLLSGKTVAIKDNTSVAGLPFTGGTHEYHLSKDTPYPIPDIDATVVSRVLENGGTILGTSTCENYCFSALSFTSATGPVDNPWMKGHACGGSSSGSAALIAVKAVRKFNKGNTPSADDDGLGEGVDFAIGGDQGGSIRLPAAYSGIYGLKPTHGLVPYTGLAALHPMLDHCGPMAGSIRDTALLLTVLAGYDGFDPRMTPETPLRNSVPQYHSILDQAIEARKAEGVWTPTTAASGMRIGILKEAWDTPQLSTEVAATVRKAVERFTALGGIVEEVSIPIHADGPAIFTAVARAQMADVFIHNKAPDLLSHPLPNLMPPRPDQKWFETMNKSAPTVVNVLLSSAYLSDPERFPLAQRGKALMHLHQLRAAYDAALEKYDVLITPANPTVGMRHPSSDLSVVEKNDLALGITANTSPFNITGHPGLAMPVGWGKVEDGEGRLPIGMHLVGKRWDESKLLLVAAAWEVGGLGLDG